MAFRLCKDGIPLKREDIGALLEQEQQKSEEQAITVMRALRRQLQRYEQRYERSSDAMLHAVETGQIPETAEVCRWLISYRVLRTLEGACTAGTA